MLPTPIPTGRYGGAASVWNRPVAKVKPRPKPRPATPAAVAAPAAAPPASPNGDISTADPRDATYGAGLAALLGQVQNQRQSLQAADATDQQGFTENLGRIAKNRSGSIHDANVTSSHQGLAFSGILGKRVGDTNAAYDDQVNQNRSALTARQAQRQLQLQEIGNLTADPNSPYGYSATGGAGMSFYDLLRSAADRRAQAAANEAPPADVTPPDYAQASLPTPAAKADPKLPTYHATAKPAKPKRPGPIHGSSTVTLKRKK